LLSLSWRVPFLLGCFFLFLAGRTIHAASEGPSGAHRLKEASWKKRHERLVTEARSKRVDVMLLGDSITQGWADHRVWRATFSGKNVLNAGISSDGVEHVLWRVKNGLLDRARPKVVVLLAGVNDLSRAKPEQIAATSDAIIDEIRLRSPKTKILLLGVFPSGAEPTHKRRSRITALNSLLARQADGQKVVYLDIGRKFLETDGRLSKSVMYDHLHLTLKGYEIWAEAMTPKLDAMLD